MDCRCSVVMAIGAIGGSNSRSCSGELKGPGGGALPLPRVLSFRVVGERRLHSAPTLGVSVRIQRTDAKSHPPMLPRFPVHLGGTFRNSN